MTQTATNRKASNREPTVFGSILLFLFLLRQTTTLVKPDSSWEKILTSNDEIKVKLMANKLKEEGIEAVVMNKKDSSYLFGYVELYVVSSEKEEAMEILNLNK